MENEEIEGMDPVVPEKVVEPKKVATKKVAAKKVEKVEKQKEPEVDELFVEQRINRKTGKWEDVVQKDGAVRVVSIKPSEAEALSGDAEINGSRYIAK